ncbi:hypothetical protein [Paenibacillus bovis]|uniref:Uncharacterized protein n=1 Tax=Paenibacillus bovis TaxID=1616788 RepID=A0A172ZAP3_9BACL|nr:hypothetical protein [Paenibacillus bovis]ANF94705.1 hypothetical protein AR543_00765 [Paenibacillus bovis]
MNRTKVTTSLKSNWLLRLICVLVALIQLYTMITNISINMQLGRTIDWMDYIPNVGLAILFLTWACINEQFFIRGDERLDAIRKQAIYLTFYFIIGYAGILGMIALLSWLTMTALQALTLLLYMGSITLQIIHAILLRKN